MLIDELCRKEEGLVIFDLDMAPEFIERYKSKAVLVKGDVTNVTELIRVIKDNHVKRIVHLASLLAYSSQLRPMDAFKVNLGGTLNVLESCRIMDVERVVFASSEAVYGPTDEDKVVDEGYPKNPDSIYGITKLASELFGVNYHESYGIDFVALRFRLIYGPGRVRGNRLIEPLILNPLKGEPAKVPGGSQKYDPLYDKDAVNALVLALFAGNLKHRAYNIGSGEMVSLQEIASIVKKYIPDAVIQISPGHTIGCSVKGPFSLELARKDLGYQPRYSIEDGVKDFIARVTQKHKMVSG